MVNNWFFQIPSYWHLPNILSRLMAPRRAKKVHKAWDGSTHSKRPRATPLIPWCTSPSGRSMKLSTSPGADAGSPRCTTQYSLRSRRASGSAGNSAACNVPGSHEVMPKRSMPRQGGPMWLTSTNRVSPSLMGLSMNTKVWMPSGEWMQAIARSLDRSMSAPRTGWKRRSASSVEGRPRDNLWRPKGDEEEEEE